MCSLCSSSWIPTWTLTLQPGHSCNLGSNLGSIGGAQAGTGIPSPLVPGERQVAGTSGSPGPLCLAVRGLRIWRAPGEAIARAREGPDPQGSLVSVTSEPSSVCKPGRQSTHCAQELVARPFSRACTPRAAGTSHWPICLMSRHFPAQTLDSTHQKDPGLLGAACTGIRGRGPGHFSGPFIDPLVPKIFAEHPLCAGHDLGAGTDRQKALSEGTIPLS